MDTKRKIDTLKGVGARTQALFEKAGVCTIEELITYYPRGYVIYEAPGPISGLAEGECAAVRAVLLEPVSGRYVKALHISTACCRDETGELNIVWYHMPYLKNSLKTGVPYIFRGRIGLKNHRLLMEQPAVFREEQYQALSGRMIPQYPLVKGLTDNMVRKAMAQALELWEPEREYLPDRIRSDCGLCEYNFAIRQIHFPADRESFRIARERIVFDEFFFFLLQLRNLRQLRRKNRSFFVMRPAKSPDLVIRSLPYELTAAQKRVWKTLEQELAGEDVMARLVQGDVGSGKTIVSILALLMTAENGLQGAVMAPTEVLARQHYQTIVQILEQNNLPWKAVLLTGSMTAKEKREACARIRSGEASVIVGTHALIQESVEYSALALVIIDEQHRFGVRQREALAGKGKMPHMIVMSATPIPRTLAVILYGDLDVSVIDELPASRLPVKNCVVNTDYRKAAYRFITGQAEKGHQAYVICPMVEESEAMEAENVKEYAQMLCRELPGWIRVEYLHGRMKPKEKNEIMERFLNNEIQVLVSTTVVEVGVNVPNATVMMVENSERFGLAQLHQLRGRIGRGDAQSYCIFVHSADGKQIRERLDILNHSNDGFEIARRDMQLRGPGDLFGVRQSGMIDFALADVCTDADILRQADQAVNRLLEEDRDLEQEENLPLKARLEQLRQSQPNGLNL